MKARLVCALCALMLIIPQVSARADVRQSLSERALVRLQVVARSNAPEDQQTKLRVRDAVREIAIPLAAAAHSPDEAFALLAENLAPIEAAARAVDATARVEAVTTRFPLRIYGKVMVPPGTYRALRVTLGGGEGRNWWCVVYPDLCATDAAAAAALRAGEPIRFYSSILRWLFGGDET